MDFTLILRLGEQEEGGKRMWGLLRSKVKKKDDKSGAGDTMLMKEFENNPRCIFIKTDAFKNKAEARRTFFDEVSEPS
mgnify:CR=1 FL=1